MEGEPQRHCHPAHLHSPPHDHWPLLTSAWARDQGEPLRQGGLVSEKEPHANLDPTQAGGVLRIHLGGPDHPGREPCLPSPRSSVPRPLPAECGCKRVGAVRASTFHVHNWWGHHPISKPWSPKLRDAPDLPGSKLTVMLADHSGLFPWCLGHLSGKKRAEDNILAFGAPGVPGDGDLETNWGMLVPMSGRYPGLSGRQRPSGARGLTLF